MIIGVIFSFTYVVFLVVFYVIFFLGGVKVSVVICFQGWKTNPEL